MHPQYTPEDIQRFWSKIDKSGDCWVWTGARLWSGYGRFAKDGQNIRAHRLSWELHNGPIPDDLCVLHRCDNRRCCNPDHLWLGTRADNAADRHAKGRTIPGIPGKKIKRPSMFTYKPKGESHHSAKMTAQDVREIRRLYATGMFSQPELSRRFGIKQGNIWAIIHYKTWKHVP